MIRPPLYTQDLFDCRDAALVGGKAANLGRLLRAGFPVPEGFCITTRAYRHARAAAAEGGDVSGNGDVPRGALDIPPDLAEAIRLAYDLMGGGAVAVRSSATAEDSAAASMAGQYETFLHVRTAAELLDAVRACWASLDSPRTRAYLGDRGIDPAGVAMAVVVQRLVPADVAGVLFTANPRTGSRGEMLVEASWGLGEAVVSGRVQPDVLRVDAATGRVLDARIADKRVLVAAGQQGERPVAEDRRRSPCLRSADVARLWQLGRRAAEYFGAPQDLEWAIHAGELFLLQSRPITTLEEAEAYEDLLRTTRAELRDRLAAGRGPWVLHNLAETLPHPTPLTWSVVRRLMSGAGGYGAMYAKAGFEPSPEARAEGFLDRIAGRVYMDASRAPGMFFPGFPFRYDVDALRRDPDAGQSPPTVSAGTLGERIRIGRRLKAAEATMRRLARDFDRKLRDDVIPAFVTWAEKERGVDLAPLTAEQLIDLWHARERAVLDEFAPLSLLPSLLAGQALADLRAFLDETFWDDDPDALAQFLSSGAPADRTARSDALLYQVAQGARPLADWLAEYGHRAAGEFDLAAPRWREQPEQAASLAARLKGGADPAERHQMHAEAVRQRVAELKAKLSPGNAAELDRLLDAVWRYVPFREDGKHYLMLGYALLRDVALEAGRRLEVGEDVFLLTFGDLADALRVGFAPHHLIARRKTDRRAEAKVTLPRVIDADAVDALGEPPKADTAAGTGIHSAFALSTGAAAGPARIVRSPAEAGDLGRGYVLVCPSTDPSWTPLFVNAAALVLECGGTLSHGAVVAREMGLPAVVLPGATQLLADGETIHVDGRNGLVSRTSPVAISEPVPGGSGDTVNRVAAASTESATAQDPVDVRTVAGLPAPVILSAAKDLPRTAASEEILRCAQDDGPAQPDIERAARSDPDNPRIPRELVPPPPGRVERRMAKVRNVALAAWGVYLLAAFGLPEAYVHRPTMQLMDAVLWPIVRTVGRAGTVAVVAVVLAATCILIQRFFTDNARLREAKRRAARLSREAAALPEGSPRRRAMLALAAPVQWRVSAASMLPVALLLGVMTVPFVWFTARLDPAQTLAGDPGASVTVVATVDSDLRTPVTLHVAQPLEVDAATPAEQPLPPIREALERFRAKLNVPSPLPPETPWELREAAEYARAATIADLDAYLAAGVPPRAVTWVLRAPPGTGGRFPVTVAPAAGGRATVDVVLGDRYAPAPDEARGANGSAVRSVKVVYPHSQTKASFWPALERVIQPEWGVGWLILVTYLLAYLPVLYGLRAALRVREARAGGRPTLRLRTVAPCDAAV